MTAKITICAADAVPEERLRQGMIAGFTGYAVPVQPDAKAFAFMMRQRGLDAACSRIAVQEDRVVAIWLVSREGENAYLMASGTDLDFRGQGLARRLAEASAEALRKAGATRLLTEVIIGNDVAARLYHRLGMELQRKLSCFELGPLSAPSPAFDLQDVHWSALRDTVKSCRDWPPTWQNSDAALSRVPEDLTCLHLRDERGLAGYAVLLRPNGSVAQIAVRPDRRRGGLGRALLAGILARQGGTSVRIINADAGDPGFAAFMRALEARPITGQHALVGGL